MTIRKTATPFVGKLCHSSDDVSNSLGWPRPDLALCEREIELRQSRPQTTDCWHSF